jgi:hypothetical protein
MIWLYLIAYNNKCTARKNVDMGSRNHFGQLGGLGLDLFRAGKKRREESQEEILRKESQERV